MSRINEKSHLQVAPFGFAISGQARPLSYFYVPITLSNISRFVKGGLQQFWRGLPGSQPMEKYPLLDWTNLSRFQMRICAVSNEE